MSRSSRIAFPETNKFCMLLVSSRTHRGPFTPCLASQAEFLVSWIPASTCSLETLCKMQCFPSSVASPSLQQDTRHIIPISTRGIRNRHPHSPNINDHRRRPKMAAVCSFIHELCRYPIIQVRPKNRIPKVGCSRCAAQYWQGCKVR